jgi:hypothetical protein
MMTYNESVTLVSQFHSAFSKKFKGTKNDSEDITYQLAPIGCRGLGRTVSKLKRAVICT